MGSKIPLRKASLRNQFSTYVMLIVMSQGLEQKKVVESILKAVKQYDVPRTKW